MLRRRGCAPPTGWRGVRGVRRRLDGFDAQFLYHESATQPQHTLKLAILEPPGGPRRFPDVVHKAVAARLRREPLLRWRMQRVPLGLHHPVWVAASDLLASVLGGDETTPSAPPGIGHFSFGTSGRVGGVAFTTKPSCNPTS